MACFGRRICDCIDRVLLFSGGRLRLCEAADRGGVMFLPIYLSFELVPLCPRVPHFPVFVLWALFLAP